MTEQQGWCFLGVACLYVSHTMGSPTDLGKIVLLFIFIAMSVWFFMLGTLRGGK